MSDYPVVICGGGPAGASASFFLSDKGIKHLLIDKAVFPRDKICGDAVSGKGIDRIADVFPNEIKEFIFQQEISLPAYGIQFVAPNGKAIDIAFPNPKEAIPPGFISKRLDFDNFMFSLAKKAGGEVWEGSEVIGISKNQLPITNYQLPRKNVDKGLELEIDREGRKEIIRTNMVIGADGSRSAVKKYLHGEDQDEKHFCGGIRAYYTNVEGLHQENFLELHFIKELLPGYFWIFPLPNGSANIGLGMLSRDIRKKKVNLRKELLNIVENHPTLSKRFKSAKLDGKILGWGLPLGSKKRPISGNNYLLTGDAASLIDPFTGEGIGNAIVSGKIASKVAEKALAANQFDAALLKSYDTAIYKEFWKELKLSHTMQKLSSYPWMFNFVVNKLNSSRSLQDLFSGMFNDIELRAKMQNPLFYFKLLFNK